MGDLMPETSKEEIKIASGRLKVAAVALVFTAIATIANLVFTGLDYRLEKRRSEEEAAYKLARLDYEVVMECIPYRENYLVERIRVTNNGNAPAENVRIVVFNTGVEVITATSMIPHQHVAVDVETIKKPMTVVVPTIKLDPRQHYEMKILLAKYGETDSERISTIFNVQRDNLQITTSTRTPSQDSQGVLKDIEGMPQLVTHEVVSGDTIPGIAKEYNLNEDTLIQYNPKLGEKLPEPGQRLIIQPATCGRPIVSSSVPVGSLQVIGEHVVKEDESLYCIARAYRVSPWSLAARNGLGPPYEFDVGQTIAVPYAPASLPGGPVCEPQFELPEPACRAYHDLRDGETLRDVAATYNVDLLGLAAQNDIYTYDQIYSRQRLCVPE